jgi:hypothetical protein
VSERRPLDDSIPQRRDGAPKSGDLVFDEHEWPTIVGVSVHRGQIHMSGAKQRRTLLPAPWRRVDSGSGKIGSRYAHPAGYTIEHCGHPTALWPYALYGPDGAMILAPNGRAWRTLQDAGLHVINLARKDANGQKENRES